MRSILLLCLSSIVLTQGSSASAEADQARFEARITEITASMTPIQAKDYIKELSAQMDILSGGEKASEEDQLIFYGYYKQAIWGDVDPKKVPETFFGFLSQEGYKTQQWRKMAGRTTADCVAEYIRHAKTLYPALTI